VVRTMTALIVAACLSGSQIAAQQPAQPQQPPVSRPPAEQLPAPTPTPTTPPATPDAQIASARGNELDRSTAGALLDRIEVIVKDALQDQSSKDKKDKDKDSKAVGTSGKLESAGKVTVDRSALDEILAEVALLKTMIRR